NEDATMFILMLSIFNILLYKITGHEDIVVGTVVSGRKYADLENIIGFFVNTLVLRNYPQREKTFIEFLRETKNKTLHAFDNQDYPFEDLVENVACHRESARNPLFDVLFSFSSSNRTRVSPQPPDTDESALKLKAFGEGENNKVRVKFDLLFTGGDSGDGLSFVFQYRVQLFRKETIEKFIDYFKDIVSAVTEDERIQLGNINIDHELGAAAADVYESDEIEFEF
ncbi:MAG: hypothetical protein GY757_40765, partial [bacterium]|nr:hypothetical protein [bacterium]